MSDEARKLVNLGRRRTPDGVRIKRGTIVDISPETYAVVIDGDSAPTDVPAWCGADVGDRAIILCDGTEWAVIASRRKGADGNA